MVAGYSRRLFLIGIVRSIQGFAGRAGALPEQRRRILKPSHRRMQAALSRYIRRGDKTSPLLQSLASGRHLESSLLCIRYERGTRDPPGLIHSLYCYRFQTLSGLCDIKTGTTLHQPHSILYIGGDDIASAGVSIPAVSCIADDFLVAERVENL
jgi:hypothetical protein